MLNIALNLERNASLTPDKPAIIFMGRELSYGELNKAASKIANGLRAVGIGQGDKVALSCPNTPGFPIVYYGILKSGAIVVPINVLLKSQEIAYILNDSEAKAYFCHEGSAELPLAQEGKLATQAIDSPVQFFLIKDNSDKATTSVEFESMVDMMQIQSAEALCENTSADDTAVILYTSGTTGQPKGAELTHSNMAMNAMVASQLLRQSAEDVHLLALPLFHTFGQTVQMNAALLAGATLVLVPRFDPELVFGLIQRYHVSIFVGVPTMYVALLNLQDVDEKHDLPTIAKHLRLGVSGGAAMSVEIIRQFESRFGISILEGYGLTETCPIATFWTLEDQRIPGSVGRAIWGTDVRVVDKDDNILPYGEEGEVVIRGHNVMKGYYRRPDATAEALRGGWFHTGDVGRFDENGHLYIVDRLKDMIIRGGFNVYPREVEEILMTHPAVAQVSVIGVPHAIHGEEIKAVIQLKQGFTIVNNELIEWCKENMASYKYPRLIEVRENLPMNATGKILKRELR